MKRNTLVIVICLLLFLVTCQKTKNFENNLNELFSLEKVIYLDNSTNELIGISKIYINKSYIIIKERKTNLLYLYSMEGKYLNNIGNKGNGPGEYLDASDVEFFNNYIYVFDAVQQRLNEFSNSGEYISSDKLPYSGYDLEINSVGEKYLYSSIVFKPEKAIHKYNSKNIFIKKFIEPSKNYFPRGGSIGGGIILDNEDNLYQIHPYEYTLCKYSSKSKKIFSSSYKREYYREPKKPNFQKVGDLKEKSRWYRSWTKIKSINLINNKFLVVLLENWDKQVIDIFDKNGKQVYNLDPCMSVHCLAVHKNNLFVVTFEEEKITDNPKPKLDQVIHIYRFKEN